MEADHRPAGCLAQRGHREAPVVCIEMQNRNLSQDPKVRMQDGGIQAQNRRASASADLGLLRADLADLLDDDGQSIGLKRTGVSRLHEDRASTPRSLGPKSRARSREKEIAALLHHQSGQPRRLSCPSQRSCARQHRHVARAIPIHRHRTGIQHGARCG